MVDKSSTLRGYLSFEGRANRKEYWRFVFCTLGVLFVFTQVKTAASLWITIFINRLMRSGGPVASTMPHAAHPTPFMTMLAILNIVAFLVNLALAVPNFCIFVRRLHDTGRSAKWTWLFLPIVLSQVFAGFYGFVLNQSYFGNARLAWWLLASVARNPLGMVVMMAAPCLMYLSYVCGIILFGLACLPGRKDSNRFGPPSDSEEAAPSSAPNKPLPSSRPPADAARPSGYPTTPPRRAFGQRD